MSRSLGPGKVFAYLGEVHESLAQPLALLVHEEHHIALLTLICVPRRRQYFGSVPESGWHF